MRAWKIVVIVLVVIIGAIFIAYSFMANIVSSKLSSLAKVPVSISNLSVRPGQINIDNFVVGNPRNSILKHALIVKKAEFQAPLGNYFDQTILIPEVALFDTYVGLEFESKRSSRGNWTYIMANIEREMEKKHGKSDKEVFIRRLILTNVQVELVYHKERERRKLKPIGRIELKNISSRGGFPTGQITNLIIKEMLKEIFSVENIMNMLQDLLSPQGGGQDLYGTLKSLFSHEEEAIQSGENQ